MLQASSGIILERSRVQLGFCPPADKRATAAVKVQKRQVRYERPGRGRGPTRVPCFYVTFLRADDVLALARSLTHVLIYSYTDEKAKVVTTTKVSSLLEAG